MEGEERGRKKEGEDKEGELSKEEVRRVVRKLKDGKAGGGDGLTNEVWKYGGGGGGELVMGNL